MKKKIIFPKDKHALVIQGTEKEKQQACIEIRDWAVKNNITMPDILTYESILNFSHCNYILWNGTFLDACLRNFSVVGYTIHHTVDSFKKVFEVHEPAPTPFGEAIILLRDLADLQNGAPLEQHRKEWEETMEKVYSFLNRWEEPIELTNPKN